MGTRGVIGVRIDEVDKTSYNHWDSYPEGLGVDVIKDIEKLRDEFGRNWVEETKRLARQLVVQKRDVPVPESAKRKYAQYADLSVSSQTMDNWYCLLHELQGKLYETLKGGIILDSDSFILDSLFCEWGYLLNLDDEVLELYRGFQTKYHEKGRYANEKGVKEGYYPCALVSTFPISTVNVKDFKQYIVTNFYP